MTSVHQLLIGGEVMWSRYLVDLKLLTLLISCWSGTWLI